MDNADTPNENPVLLLVDDDEIYCEVLADALTKRNYAVSTAHNLATALELARDIEPEYAVVDLRIGTESGLQLVKQLAELDDNTRIVILTGFASVTTAVESIKLGAVHYLTKPATADEVVAALHRQTGIVAIEQPELHIHPAFQVALGDLFIKQVREHSDLTFILETHSEHLMLRFLRRIRETGENEAPDNRTLTPAELSIYFIEQDEKGISCTSIRVDEDGDFIDRWPRGFFAERAGELF